MESSCSEEFLKVEPDISSLLEVPNVQELVKKDPLQVPERYIRFQQDRPSNMDETYHSAMVPVIDFSLLSMRDQNELKNMDKACQEWGFFQLVNHGIEKEVIDNMKDAAMKFFELPLEEKEKYSMPADNIQGYGHAHVASEEQILDWSDVLVLLVHPYHYRMLKYWPKTPKNFKEMIEAYTDGIKKVGEELLRSFSVLMGMDEEGMVRIHKELAQALRLNYYPVCSKPEHVLGLSPHSDASTITILMQQSHDLVGLQIRHHGQWVSVNPIPNAFIVNAGDVMEILSNGKYKSIEHRVVTNAERPRISYASFLAPSRDAEIEPITDVSNSVKKYRKVRYEEYLKLALKKLEGKNAVEMLKLET